MASYFYKIIAVFLCVFIPLIGIAQRGKDGAVTVNTANRIVNEYTNLTANAAAGATTINVTSSTLNANGRFSGPLVAGDLIMIIQMQGVTIGGWASEMAPAGSGQYQGNPVNNTWGIIDNYFNCGNYEFAQVNAVPSGTTITLDCGLRYNYTSSGVVQVIRVPRYASLTVNNPGTIIPQAWNGSTGGVVAIENIGTTTINNANGINATALGFRGGVIENNSLWGGGQFARNNPDEGAEKGESVVGFQPNYNYYGGQYCRGQAGNGGGGGNNHNAGGGGGSNAGSLVGWDGLGNPDVSGGAGWVAAWNLEGGTFSAHTSPGGGRGGYTFSSQSGTNRNATTLAPGNATWGGDSRRNVGGLGGHVLDYTTGKIFMGGGGGAGDGDDNAAGAGGIGGGIVYLMNYGTVTGTGSIASNGGTGGASGIDGAGGGGGGGTLIINSTGAIGGISLSANGGTGGTQTVSNPIINFAEAEGPGGGGGGGYIAISNGAPAQTVNGGANGTTNSNMLTEFPPNGATRGGAGLSNQVITWDTILVRDTAICAGNTVTLSATLNGVVPAGSTILWYTTQTGGTSIASGSTFTTPIINSQTSYYVGFCPGTYREEVVITIVPPPNATITQQNPLCVSSSAVNLSAATAGGTWTGTGITNGVTGTFDPSIAGIGSHLITYTLTTPCIATDTMTINVIAAPNATITPVSTLCLNAPAITLSAATSGGIWSGTGITNGNNGTFVPASAGPGTHQITYTITSPCPAQDTVLIVVINAPNPTITQAGPYCITNPAQNLSAAAAGGTWSGTGITNTSTGTFDPAIAGLGTHVITYSIAGACPASDTMSITVINSPNATITQSGPYCVNGASVNLSAATSGGTWSGTGITNTGSGTFDPAIAGVGSHVITYTIAAPCFATDTMTIVVNTTANATITQAGPYCVLDPSINLTAATAGGTWSGTGITNATNGTFDPATAGLGTHTIIYTLSGACPGADTITITVNPTSNATITQVGPFCLANGAVTLAAASPGGAWTGTGITNGTTGVFDPSVAGLGSHIITYTIGGACPGTDTMTILVTANADATITAAGPFCETAASINLTAATAGGFWTGTGITNIITGNFLPSAAGPGSHSIIYTITGACAAADTINVQVNPSDTASIAAAGPYCVSDPAVNLTAVITGGTWTGSGITNGIAGTFDPTVAGVGTHLITYVTSGVCPGTDTMSITVILQANATINPVNPLCVNNAAVNLTAATAGGVWSGTGITNTTSGTFDPSVSGAGTFTITYIIGGNCGDTATQTVTVNPLPNPSFTSDITSGCRPVCVQFNEAVGNNCISVSYNFGDGNISTSSSPLHCYNQSGNYNVSITCTDANGCIGTATINNMITVYGPPSVSISPDVNIYSGQSTQLTASGGVTYNWLNSSGLSCNNCPNPIASPLQTTTYCVQILDANGCADTICVTVTVDDIPCLGEENLGVPNAFSPNNDGLNDEYCLQGWDNYCIEVFYIAIYDRWGEKVYDTKDAEFCWDGTYKGKIMDAQVLVYYIDAISKNNIVINKKGNISLIR